MSHQTGITASAELKEAFAKAKVGGDIRALKVVIKDEEMILSAQAYSVGSFNEDYDNLIHPLLLPEEPCYMLIRLDSMSGGQYEWFFISYTPDEASVRQKMLYAATRATLRMEFGSGDIVDAIFGTQKDDVTFAGYEKHVSCKKAPPPLTSRERELEDVRRNEVRSNVGVDTKHQTLHGVAFPLTDTAVSALGQFKKGKVNYVQLCLILEAEQVDVVESSVVDIDDLPAHIPSDQGRYHVFRFKHVHSGETMKSNVFIYSLPGYKCSIKERMLYSSCKAGLLEALDTVYSVPFERKLEVDDAKELTSQFLINELHPVEDVVKEKIDRPKGPGNRGPRRLIRSRK